MYVTASARLRCVQHSPLLPVPRHPAQAPPRWDLFKAALLAKKNLSSDFRTSPHDRRFLDLKKTTGGLNSGRLPGAGGLDGLDKMGSVKRGPDSLLRFNAQARHPARLLGLLCSRIVLHRRSAQGPSVPPESRNSTAPRKTVSKKYSSASFRFLSASFQFPPK